MALHPRLLQRALHPGRRGLASLTRVSREEGVTTITLTSPATRSPLPHHQARNALSLDMMLRVTEQLEEAGAERAVRAVVLRGEGKVFSAGHNLKEMTVDTGYDYHKRIFDTCETMMRLVGQVSSWSAHGQLMVSSWSARCQ